MKGSYKKRRTPLNDNSEKNSRQVKVRSEVNICHEIQTDHPQKSRRSKTAYGRRVYDGDVTARRAHRRAHSRRAQRNIATLMAEELFTELRMAEGLMETVLMAGDFGT